MKETLPKSVLIFFVSLLLVIPSAGSNAKNLAMHGKEAFDELITLSFDRIENEVQYEKIRSQLKKIRVVLRDDTRKMPLSSSGDNMVKREQNERHKSFVSAYELLKNLCYDTTQKVPWIAPFIEIKALQHQGYATYRQAINQGKWSDDILISLHHAMVAYVQTEDFHQAVQKISDATPDRTVDEVIQTIMPRYFHHAQAVVLPFQEKLTRRTSLVLPNFSLGDLLKSRKVVPTLMTPVENHQDEIETKKENVGTTLTLVALSMVGSSTLLHLYRKNKTDTVEEPANKKIKSPQKRQVSHRSVIKNNKI